jgi:hypothetical protein
MRRAAASVAFALVAATSAVQGQGLGDPGFETGNRTRFGFGGGVVVPRTKARFQDLLTGATGQAFVLVRFAPGLPSLRIGADFSRMTFSDPVAGAAGSIFGTARSQLGGIMSLRFDLAQGPVRPYLLAGVGAFSTRDEVYVVGSLSGGTAISSSDVGVDGGAGVSFRLGRINGFVETRIQNVYAKEGFINTKSILAIPVTFGLIF